MAAPVKFEDLALQYVLSDEPEQAKSAAQKAAFAIESTANNRPLVHQWVTSINRWITAGGSADDGEPQDDDFIFRAKALDFLASTLMVLKRDTLRADQVQLLVSFFCALFPSDHKAGVTASAKALRQLTSMKMFKPVLGNDIIEGVCKLGDDFKLQAPATRLEIYQLILGLLQDPSVSNDLEYRHGDTCGFMTGLLSLCRNERDPSNLMTWFETLKIFLQNFSPSPDVTSEVFKTFSAYFPISLRASATPSGITADDLKGAVRACFAAHYRLASHTIPYLIGKLDQGDAVTVAVKLDILQTLNACVSNYGHPKQSVVPYVSQVWNSLKYEVRNGEITEAIEATLKVITSLTARLDEDDLPPFFKGTAWRDLVEDLSSPAYTSQAGRLLVAILGASAKSFSMITPVLAHVQTTIKSTNTASHKRDLLALLNWILLVRSSLASSEDVLQSLDNPLKDEIFGDGLFFETYLPTWKALIDHNEPGWKDSERIEIFNRVMEGLATLVTQQSYGAERRRLATDSTCTQIFDMLSEITITHPLKDESFVEPTSRQVSTDKELRNSAALALKKAVPQYPQGFQQLLLLYIESIKTLYPTRAASHGTPFPTSDFSQQIKQIAAMLCDVACLEAPGTPLPLADYILLISTLLDGLFWMLAQRANPAYWSIFITSIHQAVSRSLVSISIGLSPSALRPQPISAETYASLSASYERVLQISLHEQGGLESIKKATEKLQLTGSSGYQQLLVYSLCVVKQLYRRFTDIYPSSDGSSKNRWDIGLHKDLESDNPSMTTKQDICIYQLAMFATSVIRALDEEEQKALRIDGDVFVLFHGDDETTDKTRLQDEVLNDLSGFSPLNEYRTASLSLGILQGLYPGAIDHEYHINALRHLGQTLTSVPPPSCSDLTREVLDVIWTILSNKFVIKGEDRRTEWLAIQEEIMTAYRKLWSSDAPKPETSDVIRIFRSILYFLSGDIARFQGDPKMNRLLGLICDQAPSDPVLGRQLAENFELLLSPKECLQKENHAIRKRLAEAWVYHQVVQPYLGKCFPSGDSIQEHETTNRAVATFAMLKYAKYEHYADDVAQIVRIAIRSLSTAPELRENMNNGEEIESCLFVLLSVLEKDPETLKGHLSGLIKGLVKVYDGARWTGTGLGGHRSLSPYYAHALDTCRKHILDFFRKLPATYEAHTLLPYQKQLLRHLSEYCGDAAREIRRIALAARQAWESLA